MRDDTLSYAVDQTALSHMLLLAVDPRLSARLCDHRSDPLRYTRYERHGHGAGLSTRVGPGRPRGLMAVGFMQVTFQGGMVSQPGEQGQAAGQSMRYPTPGPSLHGGRGGFAGGSGQGPLDLSA